MQYRPIVKKPNLAGKLPWQKRAVAIMDTHMSKSATQLMTTFFDAPTAMCCTPFFASSLINPIDTPTCTHHRYSDAQAQDHTNDCYPVVFQHMHQGPYDRLEYSSTVLMKSLLAGQPAFFRGICMNWIPVHFRIF